MTDQHGSEVEELKRLIQTVPTKNLSEHNTTYTLYNQESLKKYLPKKNYSVIISRQKQKNLSIE